MAITYSTQISVNVEHSYSTAAKESPGLLSQQSVTSGRIGEPTAESIFNTHINTTHSSHSKGVAQ
jgi:hypothetical protein